MAGSPSGARICGTGRAAERRQGLELLEGDSATPDAVAATLNAMTFALGRRFIVVDGVERWKDKDLDRLVTAIAQMPPDTTIAFFAREDGRGRAPQRLGDAVREPAATSVPRKASSRELPKWVIARARELGLELAPDAARALVANVGERQQRLLRELEKLALDVGTATGDQPPQTVDAELVDELTAPSAERRAWGLADALVAGEPEPAIRALLALRMQGERLGARVLNEQPSTRGPPGCQGARARRTARAGQAHPADASQGRRSADRRCQPIGANRLGARSA